jgi:hypothetical protein
VRARPLEAHRAIHDYARLTDEIVTLTLDYTHACLHPMPNPTESERLCVIAVGGYGRGEMAPFSDVDLLFLMPYKQTPWGESMIESVLYTLWDLRMKVGHSVRTVADCLRLAKGDVTIRTTLLEHRILWGDRALGEELDQRLWSELFERTGPEFVEMKLAERAERHRRQGSTRYLLEPNVKESKGGLRDLQTLYWIAKYLNHADSLEDLVERGVFTPEEVRIFSEAAAFLWTTRVHLHLLTAARPSSSPSTPRSSSPRSSASAERAASARSSASCSATSARRRTWATSPASSSPRSRPSTSPGVRGSGRPCGRSSPSARPGQRAAGLPDAQRAARRGRPGGVPRQGRCLPAALRGEPRERRRDPSRRAPPGRGEPAPDRRRRARRPGGEPALPRPPAVATTTPSGRCG